MRIDGSMCTYIFQSYFIFPSKKKEKKKKDDVRKVKIKQERDKVREVNTSSAKLLSLERIQNI